MMNMNISIVGLGYVGLTLAVYLAKCGCRVHGIDKSDDVIKSLDRGHAHFYEKNFNPILRDVIRSRKFTFSKELPDEFKTDIYIITVGTPIDEHQNVNLKPIEEVTKLIARRLAGGELIILRSTVKVGVTRQIVDKLLQNSGVDYCLSFCPERTLEGNALRELESLPQIVSGINDKSLNAANEFFASIGSDTVCMQSLEEAEVVKLLNNSERDLLFALANEIGMMCDSLKISASNVIKAANYRYPRSSLKSPGTVGGPCLEKDPHILTESFMGLDYAPTLFRNARRINKQIIPYAVNKVAELASAYNSKIECAAVLGIAFKGEPLTGDTRGSLASDLYNCISNTLNVKPFGYDPMCQVVDIEDLGYIHANDIDSVLRKSNVIFVQHNNSEFAKYDWSILRSGCIVYDFWGVLSSISFRNGVKYVKFGG